MNDGILGGYQEHLGGSSPPGLDGLAAMEAAQGLLAREATQAQAQVQGQASGQGQADALALAPLPPPKRARRSGWDDGAETLAAPAGQVVPIPKGGTATAEVRFMNPGDAQKALKLSGSTLGGELICVEYDVTSKDGSKVIITNVPRAVEWQELKDHFQQCGKVAFANVRGGKGKGGAPQEPLTGTVRYKSPDEAEQAVALLNGSRLEDSTLEVRFHPHSSDRTKLQVLGVPAGTQWQELKEFFLQCGNVIFAEVVRPGAPQGVSQLGEVRFEDPAHAQQACLILNGSTVAGAEITVELDLNSPTATKVLVSGIPAGIQWQEVKDHFSPIGPVCFCDVKTPFGKGFSKMPMNQMNPVQGPIQVGEIRYSDPNCALQALAMLNGSMLGTNQITVNPDRTSKDGTKLLITGIPLGIEWQELKELFSTVGPVAYCNVKPVPGGGGVVGHNGQILTGAAAMQAHVRLKTKLCTNWVNGNCSRGNTCNFAHGEHEIDTPQANQGAPQARMKTKLCTNWVNGNCPRANMCNFAHGEHELGTPQSFGSAPQQQQQQQQQPMQQQQFQQQQFQQQQQQQQQQPQPPLPPPQQQHGQFQQQPEQFQQQQQGQFQQQPQQQPGQFQQEQQGQVSEPRASIGPMRS